MSGVEQQVEDLKRRYAARSDSELASRLGVHKSTVSSWRQRGAVPEKVMALLEQPRYATAPAAFHPNWDELETAAFRVGLFRCVRRKNLQTKDFREAMEILAASDLLWVFATIAFDELAGMTTATGLSPDQAASLILHDEVNNGPDEGPDEAAAQVKSAP